MKRIIFVLAIVLSLAIIQFTTQDLSTELTTQDLSKGMEAYGSGDYSTALRVGKPLAEQGDVDAQYLLGLMYQYGTGVSKDYAEALKWFRLSAEQGKATRMAEFIEEAAAQNSLGLMYQYGTGVSKDYAEALKWFRLSAEQGNASAQYSLGDFYEYGTGVLQDNHTAYIWYNISSANGYPDAGAKRDKLEKIMTSDAIERATAMAKECMNRNYKKCGY